MSPTIAIFNEAKSRFNAPKCLRIVNASSRAWVGCSWVPSPALMIEALTQPLSARRFAAPEAGCRMTIASAPIA